MARELVLALAVAACGGAPQAPVTAPTAEPPAAERSKDPAPFRIDVTPPASCARATPCEARLTLVALGGYKVNAEYPFKFVGDPGPTLAFEGTGAFVASDPHTGTMTVTFRSEAAGTIRVSGTFKLSVCTEEVCKIEQPKIAFEVPVT